MQLLNAQCAAPLRLMKNAGVRLRRLNLSHLSARPWLALSASTHLGKQNEIKSASLSLSLRELGQADFSLFLREKVQFATIRPSHFSDHFENRGWRTRSFWFPV